MNRIDDAGRLKVSKAVSKAEADTAGEIVTIMAERSDEYADVALVWSALIALLALVVIAMFPDFYLGLWDHLFGAWIVDWSPGKVLEFAAMVATLKFIGMWLLQLWRPLRLFLVPSPVKLARVRARAVTCFKVGAERRTMGRTGVLIYLSLDERRAEIVADAAITAKVTAETWGDALAAMLAEIRNDRMADGLVAAVSRVGAVLAEHFPRAEDDTNEIPDRLIEV